MAKDVIIVGAGIVGLATGLKLLENRPRTRVTILEKEDTIASHQTGHNSGVIHSGIYYKPGSMKAVNCVHGYHLLLAFCHKHDVPFELCGKLIVAANEKELPLLETLHQRGLTNGLTGITKLEKEELKEYEPHVAGLAGLHVPQTGIIDYRRVAETMARLFQEQGGEIVTGQRVHEVRQAEGRVTVVTQSETRMARVMVNCAGLYSDKVTRLSVPELNVRIIPFRGEYYKLSPASQPLVRNLIYPVPDPNFPFLGVHFTRMIHGGVEAGPNAVLAFKREGYRKSDIQWKELAETLAWPGFRKVASKYWKTGLGEMHRSYSKGAFTKALQRLLPAIKESDLVEGGSGVRAQACDRNGKLLDDFEIIENKNIINVCNAPSPAATSSLSIGETIARRVNL